MNQARAVALNVIAVSPAGPGHITAWPSNHPMPTASIINYSPGQNVANGVIVPVCDEEGRGDILCSVGDISLSPRCSPSTSLSMSPVTGIKPVRPGSGRHGAGTGFDNFPCVNTAQNVRVGLSSHMAQAANSDPLCPAGTWVCTTAQVGTTGCDTSRPDSTCDAVSCTGACVDNPAVNHRGWTATPSGPVRYIVSVNEAGVSAASAVCEMRPAWCCSRNQ